MWLNFKSDNRNSSYGTGGQIGTNLTREISRQNSTRSSTRSVKSGKSSGSNKYLRRLEEFELKTNTSEWQKNQDYKLIRARRKKVEKQIHAKLHIIRMLYIPSVLGIILGIILLFGATIRTLSDGTILWTYREQVKIVGIVITTLGVILLLTTVGLENSTLERLKREGIQEVKPIIHPDFLLEQIKFDRQTSKDSSGSSYDPDCSELEKRRLLWSISNQDEEDGFLCSSIASASSGIIPKAKLSSTDRRVRITCPDDKPKDILNTTVTDVIIDESMDCACYLGATENVPFIKVTDIDEMSRQSMFPSVTGSDSVSRTSSACSLPTSGAKTNVAMSKYSTCLDKNEIDLAKETGKLREITEETFSDVEEHG